MTPNGKSNKTYFFSFRLGVLAPDGYCRPFDVDATGYTRSEAVCIIFLQKAKDAKRIYSSVLYSKTNCDGRLIPDTLAMEKISLKKFVFFLFKVIRLKV